MVEHWFEIVQIVWVGLFCLGGWATHALVMMYATRVVPLMEDLPDPSDDQDKDDQDKQDKRWPRLSVIVPACNEAETIEKALETLALVEYPNLEIIAINDRSTDATGDIINRVASAATQGRITPLHIDTLPDGWLGKVHALHQGIQHCSPETEWILLTDADVHFQPTCLKKVLAFACDQELDFVTALPDVQTNNHFWLRVTIIALGEIMGISGKFWEVHDPNSKAFAGVGPFNLMRKTTYDKSKGMEWLKMEVSEDVGVGLLMRLVGAKMAMFNARNEILWTWYPSLGAMVRGLEKNLFSLSGFQYMPTTIVALLLIMTAIAPVFAFVPFHIPWLQWCGVAILVLHCIYGVVYSRWLNFNPLAGIFLFLGKIIVAGMFFNAMWQFRKRQGILWRGTFYPHDLLQEGSRVSRFKVLLKEEEKQQKTTDGDEKPTDP
ncbi:Poly-beta-1,6-N-acetyl-D-glucosamine synthase [Seminavis robusta]|uniref:Poly-beta-1,6-N-acetyl-D-glucosamine synthase n=1 Tax=Seminavis robusta TaxID=568900 RepID=A0A9N8EIX6_9STRA|nr:Poly-beta-1,6-N-acetyl-D-glucosamine synthase [Seminavis robusta]|eukprot:Sro1175_g249220.1 Poly-beta-1,6-N-acetyl-D-glucosamine synthase (435) ;mRNA; r:32350-33654